MKSEAEIAWAAGLFEGEGHISLMRQRRRKDGTVTVSLLIGMVSTDHDVVTRFHGIVECGNVSTRDPKGGHKRQWVWQAAAVDDVQRVLRMFAPWFCSRRAARAQEVLAEYAASPVRRISKTHCPHGHEYTPENTMQISGSRRCRECNRISQKKQWAKRKAVAWNG